MSVHYHPIRQADFLYLPFNQAMVGNPLLSVLAAMKTCYVTEMF